MGMCNYVWVKTHAYGDTSTRTSGPRFEKRVIHKKKKEDEEEVWYEQLNAAIAADPNAIPDVAPENQFEQRKAKARLETADDLW